MELDDFKRRAREIKAPSDLGARGDGAGADRLLEAIRSADEHAAVQARKAKPLYAIAAAAFLAGSALTLASATPAADTRALHLAVLGGVFLLVALLMHRKTRSLARLDYSRPVNAFLAEAEGRYRLMRPLDLAYAIPLLLLLALTGGRLVLAVLIPRYVAVDHAAVVAWGYAVFFLAVCGLGCFFTYRDWQKENGAIWAEIRRMRQEME